MMIPSPLRARPEERPTVLPDGPGDVEIDLATLVAVSALAWMVADVLHEIVGHAGAAWLLGIPVRAVSTTTAHVDWTAVETASQNRIINAAATPVNVLTGAIALIVLRRLRPDRAALRYFLWLFASVSFTMATWNMVTLPLLGAGDWGEVAENLDHAWIWTAVVIASGSVVAILGYRASMRWFLPDLHAHPGLRHRVTAIPVATMILVQTLSVLPSPFATAPGDANHLLASIFAYAHLIAWAAIVNRGIGPRSGDPVDDVGLPRSPNWLVAGAVAIIAFIAVLGPGIGPLEDDPRLRP